VVYCGELIRERKDSLAVMERTGTAGHFTVLGSLAVGGEGRETNSELLEFVFGSRETTERKEGERMNEY